MGSVLGFTFESRAVDFNRVRGDAPIRRGTGTERNDCTGSKERERRATTRLGAFIAVSVDASDGSVFVKRTLCICYCPRRRFCSRFRIRGFVFQGRIGCRSYPSLQWVYRDGLLYTRTKVPLGVVRSNPPVRLLEILRSNVLRCLCAERKRRAIFDPFPNGAVVGTDILGRLLQQVRTNLRVITSVSSGRVGILLLDSVLRTSKHVSCFEYLQHLFGRNFDRTTERSLNKHATEA